VESDLLWLHLPVLDINLVATENNGDVVTHPALGGYISSVQGHDAQRVSDKVMLTDIGLYAMLVHSCM